MFEQAVRGLALAILVVSGLFLALVALTLGCLFGGLAGYSSISLLQFLQPQAIVGGSVDEWEGVFILCGAIVGVVGTMFLLGRIALPEIKQSADSRMRSLARRVERLWHASST